MTCYCKIQYDYLKNIIDYSNKIWSTDYFFLNEYTFKIHKMVERKKSIKSLTKHFCYEDYFNKY